MVSINIDLFVVSKKCLFLQNAPKWDYLSRSLQSICKWELKIKDLKEKISTSISIVSE